jgi:hypothetical protein
MKRKAIKFLASALVFAALSPSNIAFAGQTITDCQTGVEDGFNYELWKDNGNTSMTLNGGGTFSCSWSNINNALFRKGKKFDCTKTYKEIGDIKIDFDVDYKPSGNSYLCVYGWSRNPLVEYYIVESWGTWRPPGAQSKGTITVDGAEYDVYETDRINQPSIDGDTTFKQFWSVRKSKRTSGTISVTEHFKAWEKIGMKLGNLYEAALNVEGYQSSGSANVLKNNLTIGSSTTEPTQPSKPTQPTEPTQPSKPTQPTEPTQPTKEGKLKVDYNINNWGSGYVVNFKITNNSSSDVNGWTLKVKKNDLNITSNWNINVEESGDYYLITPVSWNSYIAKGNSIDFGVQGVGSIGNTLDYTLS